MEPGLPWSPKLSGDDDVSNDGVRGSYLNWQGYDCSRPVFEETRNHKRLKLELDNNLHFRDYVLSYSRRFLAIEAVEEATAVMMGREQDETNADGLGDGMKLVQQLIACAEVVTCRDKIYASALLSELRTNALVFGTSFQRVASCFVQGLADRLALVQPLGMVGVVGPKPTMVEAEKDEALCLAYEICPHIQFGHFVANASILEALEGESFVHVVDLGMTLGLPHGHQWRDLIRSLAINREGQSPKSLRITGIGTSTERLHAIGDDLECYAQSLSLNFEFVVIECNLETLKSTDIVVGDGEVLVINSILQLHCVVKESRGALNSVLQKLHELKPETETCDPCRARFEPQRSFLP